MLVFFLESLSRSLNLWVTMEEQIGWKKEEEENRGKKLWKKKRRGRRAKREGGGRVISWRSKKEVRERIKSFGHI